MTYGVLQVSAIALGMAAFAWLSPLSTARADMSAPSGTTPATSGATPAPRSGAAYTRRGGIELHQTGRHRRQAGRRPRETRRRPQEARCRPFNRPRAPMCATTPHHYTRHTHYVWRNTSQPAATDSGST